MSRFDLIMFPSQDQRVFTNPSQTQSDWTHVGDAAAFTDSGHGDVGVKGRLEEKQIKELLRHLA